ncbi:MAG TPA: adenylate/guanylate cyclase domain-containing protein [Waterburya sp.]|jgi:PAS domain S-box-containing protein
MQNSTEINQTLRALQHRVAEQTSELKQLKQQLQEEIRQRQLLEESLRASDKLLEEKIRNCEGKMRSVFEAMTDIILLINTQENQLKDIEILPTNPNRLYESGTDIIGKTVEQFFHDEIARTWLRKAQQALDTKQTLNFDYSLPVEGDEVWFTAMISPISEDSVIWVARDISDAYRQATLRKQTQIELHQQNQRLQHEIRVRQRAEEEIFFLVSITQSIAEADDFHSALSIILRSCCETIGWDFGEAWIPNQDGSLLEYSQSWHTNDPSLLEFSNQSLTLQCPPNCGLPGRVWSSQKPEWIEDVSEQSNQIFRGSYSADAAGLKTGFGVPILFNNQVLAILIFFKKGATSLQRHVVELINAVATQLGSLIQRKQTEEALRIAEEKYHSIVENAVEGIFQFLPSGQYLSANRALARIYGYESPADLIHSIQDISRQLYVKPNHYQEFTDAIEADNHVKDFESLVYRKDGSTIWISESTRAVRDRDGKLLYYEGTVSEITERKLIQEALKFEQEQTEALLLNVLPAPIAQRLQQGENPIADRFEEVSVLFADLVGFTEFSLRKTPEELVSILNIIFSRFDELAQRYGLEKIKTIGDAYMVVGGLPTYRPDHAQAAAKMALAMKTEMVNINSRISETFTLRIGINTGPVVAGVMGLNKFIYDLWGDTVNTASRMEANGIPGEIQVTATTYERLKGQFFLEERGRIPIKGKGEMMTYLLRD